MIWPPEQIDPGNGLSRCYRNRLATGDPRVLLGIAITFEVAQVIGVPAAGTKVVGPRMKPL